MDELILSVWEAMEHLGFLIDAAKQAGDWGMVERLARYEASLSFVLNGVAREVRPITPQEIKAFRERRLTLVHSLSRADDEKMR